jgi:hypothetical protein
VPLALWLAAFAGGVKFYDSRTTITPCVVVPPEREHQGKPGCVGESRAGAERATMSFNSLGFRDREYPAKAPAGKTRVLLLGASDSLGVGLEEADTFPRRFEAELRTRGIPAEVINASTVGYCTIQSTLRLRELLAAYSPHRLVYLIAPGKCPLFDGAWAGRVEWRDGAPLRIDRTPWPGGPAAVNSFLFARPSLYFLWLTVADQWRKIGFAGAIPFWREEAERGAGLLGPTLRYLDFMEEEARSRGGSLSLLLFPTGDFVQTLPSTYHYQVARVFSPLILNPRVRMETLISVVRAAGLELVVTPFKKAGFGIPGDQHLSREGSAEFARLAAEAYAPLWRANEAKAEARRR